MYYLLKHRTKPFKGKTKEVYAIVSPDNGTFSYWNSSIRLVLLSTDRKIMNQEKLMYFANKYQITSAPTIDKLLYQVPELLL